MSTPNGQLPEFAWRKEADAYKWTVPSGWGQGRAVFGGVAVAAAAALAKTLTPRPLRTVQSQLLGPVAPGELQATARVLREGKTTTFVEVRFEQEGKERTVTTMVFGEPRPTSIRSEGPPPPSWAAPETFESMPYMPGLTPEFTQFLDFRFTEGAYPFQAADSPKFGGYIRLREHEGEINDEQQLALLDAWPCPTLSLLTAPCFASTVTWTAHLLGPSNPGTGFHKYQYETIAARNGFSTTLGHLWDSAGNHVGVTEQLVAVFD